MKHKQLLINLIFAVVVLGIAGGWFAWRAAHRTGAAALAAALTYGDANTVLDLPLTKDATYDVDTGYLTVHIQVQDGAARFVDSPARTTSVSITAGCGKKTRPRPVCRPAPC